MSLLFTILSALLALLCVIIIHELGHFFVAKACGVKVERFSIGFGKVLFSIKGKETEYVISMLPLGGYVKMLGEYDDNIPEDQKKRAYNNQPVLARMAIVLAGPITNFILAFFLFWIVFQAGHVYVKPIVGQVYSQSLAAKAGFNVGDEIITIDKAKTPNWQRVVMSLVANIGSKNPTKVEVKPKNKSATRQLLLNLSNLKLNSVKPDFLKSVGIEPFLPKVLPIIRVVQKGSPADKAGIKAGDKIIAIDGKAVHDWIIIAKDIRKRPNQKITITVLRQGKKIELKAMTGVRKWRGQKVGFIGVITQFPKWPNSMLHKVNYNALSALYPAVAETWRITAFNGVVLYKIAFGKISPKTLGGPISIFRLAGQASQAGWLVYLGFVAFISIVIGFVNILPIPGLDGGHFLFLAIEGLIRRPIPQRIQQLLLQIGILFLIFLIIYATWNDLQRIFS